MASLTAKQQSFIVLMMESDELARRGFDLLLKRPDLERFFDHLKDAGFFEPSHNPAPLAVDQRLFRVPYWSSLDYLVAVARVAGSKNDLGLAKKIMAVVRAVTVWTDTDGNRRDNYHTAHRFAEILGLVPPAAITSEELGLIPPWLASRFDRSLVGNALEEGAVARFLSSHSSNDWEKALEVFRHCTAVSWTDSNELGKTVRKPKMPIDGFWLNVLVSNHAMALGERLGAPAAELFLDRTREVFSGEGPSAYSHVYRPAIEDNDQNHSWQEVENVCVQGLRDVLLGWCKQDPDTTKRFVAGLLLSSDQIVRRIALYVVNHEWEALNELFFAALSPQIFGPGHLHELYNLLARHFGGFSDAQKAATLAVIAKIEPLWADDPPEALRRTQRQWLSALARHGYEPADQWYEELNADSSIGSLGEHPDFESYIEMSSGFGPTPYTTQDLLAFAAAGTIVERLNTFEQGSLEGPTSRALVNTLEECVRQSPELFVRLLPAFRDAKREFQYAAISGLKKAWDESEKVSHFDWTTAWGRIVTFLEELLDEEFWVETAAGDHGFLPNRDWIPPLVAELLRAGTKDDDHSYSKDLLARTWPLIRVLLDRTRAIDQPNDDAMTQAINSPKGKAVEALMSHVLRSCRIADREAGIHTHIWETVCPAFDTELAKSQGGNFEFSTLVGAYLANLLYMDQEWVRVNLDRMFPESHPANTLCALDGLAYSRAHSGVYSLLVNGGVVDRVLPMALSSRITKNLVERIALAYLRDEESLDSSRFEYLLRATRLEELEIVARFFWGVRREQLSQEQRERVIAFWTRCVEWMNEGAQPPIRLMSALGALACYLDTAEGRDLHLLLAVAPFVQAGFGMHEFLQELHRLTDSNPEGVSCVLGQALNAHVPDFDYQDRLKNLLLALASKGKRADAIKYAELARGVSGMQELFNQLTR